MKTIADALLELLKYKQVTLEYNEKLSLQGQQGSPRLLHVVRGSFNGQNRDLKGFPSDKNTLRTSLDLWESLTSSPALHAETFLCSFYLNLLSHHSSVGLGPLEEIKRDSFLREHGKRAAGDTSVRVNEGARPRDPQGH